MEENKQHFWHIMLYYFEKGKNATETHTHTHTKTCAVCGEGAGTERMCPKWFAESRAGDSSPGDAPRLGRAVEVDSDPIETLYHEGDG